MTSLPSHRCVMAYRLGVPSRRSARGGARWAVFPFLDRLEPRLVLSALGGSPPVAMLAATATDSRSVTIHYQVNQAADAGQPLQFGIYRSSDSQFDSSDALVSTWTISSHSQSPSQAGTSVDEA